MSKIVITPLGTVSPYPKGDMNCPGFLVEYNQEKLLLDCGNGVTGLLSFPLILENLNVIITHYHNDHFGDIGSIQYASYVYHNLGIIKDKVKIYLPKNDIYFKKKAIIRNESYAEYIDVNDGFSFMLGDLEISFYDNKSHSIESFMIKLQNKEYKIIYTSDIGVNRFDDLVKFCKDADLVICESSFLREHSSKIDTHMTAYDAGVLASKANIKKLLLTHFWPEEDKRKYLEEAKEKFIDVEVAVEGKKLILGS